jgi:hypothetical protein
VHPRSDEKRVASARFTLADLFFAVLVIALVLSIVSRAVRTGHGAEWRGIGLVFTVFAIVLAPILLLCVAVGSSRTARAVERDAIGYVFKTLLVILLLATWMVINMAQVDG